MLFQLPRLSVLVTATILFSLPGAQGWGMPPSGDALSDNADRAPAQVPREVLEFDAGMLFQQGRSQLSQGKYEEALQTFENYLEVVQQLGDREAEGIARYYIGWTRANLSEYQAALSVTEQALAIFQDLGEEGWQGNSFNLIASIYESLGQYENALGFYDRSLKISQQIGDPLGEATSLNNIGLLYRGLGQGEKALDFYRRSLTILEAIDEPRSQAVSLNNIGYLYYELGDYEKALELYEKSLAIDRELGYKPGQANVLSNMASAYHSLGEYDKALQLYEDSLTLEKEMDNLAGFSPTLHGMGNVYLDRGNYEKALEYYEEALEIETELGDRIWQAWSLDRIGLALLRAGDFAAASEKLFRAIAVWESLRPSLTDENKVSLFEKQADTYLYLLESLIAQNRAEDALEIAERSRARAFVELIASRIAEDSKAAIAAEPPTVEQIKAIAQAQKATLVTYALGLSELYIWVIQPQGTVSFRSVDLAELDLSIEDSAERSRVAAATGISRGTEWPTRAVTSAVRGTRDAMQLNAERLVSPAQLETEPTRRLIPRLYKSYQLLIEPIADLLPENPSDRVIFIPQGALFLIPFPALQDKQGTYLIENHTILTAPSIQVLDLTRQQREQNPADASPATGDDTLVVGNPTMPSIPLELGEPPVPLAPLPGAEAEAIAIAQLLATEAIIGDAATEAAIVRKLPDASIVHLATHGLLDELEHLGFGIPGAIALATLGETPDGTPATEDGFLTSREILDLNLKASLVVLSACNTGRGNITGDGVIGLSRAFISAGVPSVVVSLWAVPDAPTAELMTEFYRQMQNRPDKAIALREAMLYTMAQYPHPRDWAGFTLIGEAE